MCASQVALHMFTRCALPEPPFPTVTTSCGFSRSVGGFVPAPQQGFFVWGSHPHSHITGRSYSTPDTPNTKITKLPHETAHHYRPATTPAVLLPDKKTTSPVEFGGGADGENPLKPLMSTFTWLTEGTMSTPWMLVLLCVLGLEMGICVRVSQVDKMKQDGGGPRQDKFTQEATKTGRDFSPQGSTPSQSSRRRLRGIVTRRCREAARSRSGLRGRARLCGKGRRQCLCEGGLGVVHVGGGCHKRKGQGSSVAARRRPLTRGGADDQLRGRALFKNDLVPAGCVGPADRAGKRDELHREGGAGILVEHLIAKMVLHVNGVAGLLARGL
jgi:hypothetical protein